MLNEPSWRLLERLGFRREGYLVENVWVKGAYESEYHHTILKREWEARKVFTCMKELDIISICFLNKKPILFQKTRNYRRKILSVFGLYPRKINDEPKRTFTDTSLHLVERLESKELCVI